MSKYRRSHSNEELRRKLPDIRPSLKRELDEARDACLALLQEWNKQPLKFGLMPAPAGEWESELIPAEARAAYTKPFVEKWIPMELRFNKASADVHKRRETAETDLDFWTVAYVLKTFAEALQPDEVGIPQEKIEALAKKQISLAATKAALVRNKENIQQKAAALAEWDATGHNFSSMTAFARTCHKAYGVTDYRTVCGWIREHLKTKT